MKKNRKSLSLLALILITLLTGLISYGGLFGIKAGDYRTKTFGEMIVKGLDLQGGTSVLLKVQAPNIQPDDLDRVRTLISTRVDATGAVDPTITTEGTDRIRVDIPGKYQSAAIVDQLSKTGVLTFKDAQGKVVLEGKDIKEASPGYDDMGRIVVHLQMKDAGVEKFAKATEANIGKQISINMDDEMLSNPTVNDAIRNGKATITGQTSEEEAKVLAAMINNGALPYPVTTLSVQEIGATLGSSVLPNVKIAGILGILAIFLLMYYFYRVPGLMASLALAIFSLGLIAISAGLKISMSLAGIAGFLLSIGMAVDANVLIFERIKEELAEGSETGRAINSGFSQAMSSILDANITTLISGFILYYFGAGSVRGFALNLVIGVLLSMFTAIIVTRILMRLVYNAGLLKDKKAFGPIIGGKDGFKFPFFAKRKFFFIGSALVIGLGLLAGIVRGPNVGIDFAGGTQVRLSFPAAVDKVAVDDILKKYDANVSSQVVDQTKLEVRSQTLTTEKVDEAVKELKTKFKGGDNFVESVNEIGGSIGAEQTSKSIIASVLSVLGILAYVAIRFKFTLGVGAIVALIHDVLFTLAMYFLFRIPINSPLIAAILTIIGYSINDTVVIFDRIRENLALKGSKNLDHVTDTSISQTMVRTINTSLTSIVIMLLVLIFVPQIREFTVPLLLGMLSGIYSTIFIASPVYVMLEQKLRGKKHPTEKTKLTSSQAGPVVSTKEAASAKSEEAAPVKKKKQARPTYSNRYRKKTAPVKVSQTSEKDPAADMTEVEEETKREIPLADDFKFSRNKPEDLDKIQFDEDEL